MLTIDGWVSDGVAYAKLPWLSSDLLPKLMRWAAECKSSDFKSTLSLLPVEKYSFMYQHLKEKYKAMVKVKRERMLWGCQTWMFWCALVRHTHLIFFFSFQTYLGVAWGDRSWEVCVWGCCYRYISAGGLKLDFNVHLIPYLLSGWVVLFPNVGMKNAVRNTHMHVCL